jgi:hypothetical protein
MGTYAPSIAPLAELLAIAQGQYHQLVLATVEADSTSHWQEVAAALDGCYLNLNLELSQSLLDVPQRQWPYQAMALIEGLVLSKESGMKVIHRIEILFDSHLKLDPLKSLQQVARRHNLLVVWPGTYDGRYLTYAEPSHPEYCRYPTKDLIVFPST